MVNSMLVSLQFYLADSETRFPFIMLGNGLMDQIKTHIWGFVQEKGDSKATKCEETVPKLKWSIHEKWNSTQVFHVLATYHIIETVLNLEIKIVKPSSIQWV